MRTDWSDQAKHELRSALRQCRKMFGDLTAKRFFDRIKHDEKLLAVHPYLGKLEPALDTGGSPLAYRSLVVHKHYKIIYFIEEDVIRIADLWDTRREPAALVRHIR